MKAAAALVADDQQAMEKTPAIGFSNRQPH
jgi:hypothetical protein